MTTDTPARARLAALLALALAAPLAARAGDIYFWTDAAGRAHLSDSVPAEHRKAAVRVDSAQFELSPEQKREAEAKRAALVKKGNEVAPPPPARPPGPAAALSASTPRVGAEADAASPECEALQREYRESLECFAPFVNANGSLKPGAFQACRSVANPTAKCGSAKAY